MGVFGPQGVKLDLSQKIQAFSFSLPHSIFVFLPFSIVLYLRPTPSPVSASQSFQEVPSHVVLPPYAGPSGGGLLWHGAQCRPDRQVCHHQQDQQHTHVSTRDLSASVCMYIIAFSVDAGLTEHSFTCLFLRPEQRFLDEVHKDKTEEIHQWKIILKRGSSLDDQVCLSSRFYSCLSLWNFLYN